MCSAPRFSSAPASARPSRCGSPIVRHRQRPPAAGVLQRHAAVVRVGLAGLSGAPRRLPVDGGQARLVVKANVPNPYEGLDDARAFGRAGPEARLSASRKMPLGDRAVARWPCAMCWYWPLPNFLADGAKKRGYPAQAGTVVSPIRSAMRMQKVRGVVSRNGRAATIFRKALVSHSNMSRPSSHTTTRPTRRP